MAEEASNRDPSTTVRAQFPMIVRKYYEPLYNHVRRMVVSHDDARDVMQEIWIRAYQSIGTLQKAEALKSWLWRIATNESLRFLNSRRQDGTIPAENLADTLADEPEELLYTGDQLAMALTRALMTLTERQRIVFNLRHYDELSFSEIARVTESNAATVKVIYHQAKQKLKKYLLSTNKTKE